MHKRLVLTALGLLIASGVYASGGQVGVFAGDPQLIAIPVEIDFDDDEIDAIYRIKNASDNTVNGPLRILVDSPVAPEDFDGRAADGRYILYVCSHCSILPGRLSRKSVEIEIDLEGDSASGRPQIDVEAQHVPFLLQLLHNADMDSNSNEALENVEFFSGLLADFQAEYPHSTLTLSSGDNYIPGPRYNAAAEPEFEPLLGVPGVGRLDMGFMNAMGYEASAVGNHELDGGTAEFASIFRPDGSYPGALFPYLSSNLDFTTDANLVDAVTFDGQPAEDIPGSLAGTATIWVAGETIGIVGAVTPTLDQITNTGDITVLPPLENGEVDAVELAAEIQPDIDKLTAMGIDKIIMLAHMQRISIEQELATLLTDVDTIVAGGSNTRLLDFTDRVRPGDEVQGDYPLIETNPAGEPVVIVNTDGDYKYLGRLVSQFTLAGTVNLESLDPLVNGGYATDPESYEFFGAPPVNPTVAELAQTAREVIARIDEPLGLTDVFLSAARAPGVRTEETILGNLTADANLA